MALTDLIAGYFQPPAGGMPQQPASSTDPSNSTSPPGLSVLDWRYLNAVSAPAGADGLCTAVFPPVDPGQMWLVDREVISCTSATPTICLVYAGDVGLQHLRDASAAGNLDIADNNAPLHISGARSLIYRWVGADAGAVGVVGIQFRVLG